MVELGTRLYDQEIKESNPIKAELSQIINMYLIDLPIFITASMATF